MKRYRATSMTANAHKTIVTGSFLIGDGGIEDLWFFPDCWLNELILPVVGLLYLTILLLVIRVIVCRIPHVLSRHGLTIVPHLLRELLSILSVLLLRVIAWLINWRVHVGMNTSAHRRHVHRHVLLILRLLWHHLRLEDWWLVNSIIVSLLSLIDDVHLWFSIHLYHQVCFQLLTLKLCILQTFYRTFSITRLIELGDYDFTMHQIELDFCKWSNFK